MTNEDYQNIHTSLLNLIQWVESNNFCGYDPYDGLNSKRLSCILNNKINRLFITQFLKVFPFNTRCVLGIDPGCNPKGICLFLKSYLKMYRITGEKKYLGKSIELFDWLKNNNSKGYSGHCWGYNFPWQSAGRFLEKNTPTIVTTSLISNAILDLYDVTHNKECLEIARSGCDFIINDLNITERPEGLCFSYTPIDKNLCHNASLLGADLLSRVHSITNEDELLEYAEKAFDFTLKHQNHDGSWNYSIHPGTGKERKQIDFHQGFILCSIFNFIQYIQPSELKYLDALTKGAKFYKDNQFLSDGRCKYRWPRTYPIDIHNQAQGIITFSKLSNINFEYIDFAKIIANWTIKNIQNIDGYFYYQNWNFFTNKIPYMRWGQAWMMLALSTLWGHIE